MRSRPSTAAPYNSLQAALQRRFSRSFTFGVSYTLSQAKTDSAGTVDVTHPFDPGAYDYALANFDRTHYFVANYVWNLPKGQRAPGRRLLRGPCSTTGRSPGSRGSHPATRPSSRLNIAGVNAANRLLGTDAGGNAGGMQPRFRVDRRSQARRRDRRPRRLQRARYQRPRALRPLLPSQPRLQQPRPVDLQELPARRRRAAHVQLRVEMFNVFNHSAVLGRAT